MTHAPKKKPSAGDLPDFSSLREFFSAYLHEDFNDEYGSVTGAARAFVHDAGTEELSTTLRQWQQWRDQTKGKSLDEVQSEIRKLGGAWFPQTLKDLDQLGTALNQAPS
jgi:hypothetical protein